MVKNLRLLREEKGYSQQKLAEMINVSQQAIFKYEKTDNEPDISTLICLAKIFGVSVDYLIGNTDIREPFNMQLSDNLSEQELTHLRQWRTLPHNIKAVLMCLSQAYTLPINSYKNTAEHFLCGVLRSMFVYL